MPTPHRNQRRPHRPGRRALTLAALFILLLVTLAATGAVHGAYDDVVRPPDTGAIVQFGAPTFKVTEGCVPAELTVTVERAGGAPAGPVTVDYAVTAGTASQKSDYTLVGGTWADAGATPNVVGAETITFARDESSKSITVLINEDGFAERTEQLTVTLSNPTGATLGELRSATLDIEDNDTGDSTANPIDDPQNFVCQHYHDFLHRQPDPEGLAFWTEQITRCGDDAICVEAKRADVSSAFLLSIEFQRTSYLVYRMYDACLERRPSYEEFMRDMQVISHDVRVGIGDWEGQLERNTQAFAESFVTRDEFEEEYAGWDTPEQYVELMYTYAGVKPSEESFRTAVGAYGLGGAVGKARAMRFILEESAVFNRYYNGGFVLAQYMGYLRRDPDGAPDTDLTGYNYWLVKLNDFSRPSEDVCEESVALGRIRRAEMVNAFISSAEYRQRFGKQ